MPGTKTILLRIGLLCVLIATCAQANFAQDASDKVKELPKSRPNIVFFLADDLGWTGLRCFGSDFYETPNLDALARSGMKFTDAYAACTVCSPTRASIMTGMYPARLRCTDFIAGQNRPFAKLRIPDWVKQLESRYVTIAELLQSAGYRTGHIGKWHLDARGTTIQGTDPLSQGFDVSIEKPSSAKGYFIPAGWPGLSDARAESSAQEKSVYLTDWLTDQACDFIDESQDEPFFLYFAYHVPHTPIQGRQDLVEDFTQKVDPNATHNNPIYAAMVASLDQSVGRVLTKLQEHQLDQNTLIIFTSDNGGLTQRYGKHDGFTENLPLRRGKGSAYEGGVRVPAIVRWPGVTGAGEVCDEPIMTTDYYPTILEISGLSSSATEIPDVDGTSITALLRDPNARIERSLYWHYPHYHAGGDGPYSAVRRGHYRLIEFHEDNSIRLYDLENDPGEKQDLSATLPEIATQLHQDLQNWRVSVDAQMPTANPDFDPDRATQVGKRASAE